MTTSVVNITTAPGYNVKVVTLNKWHSKYDLANTYITLIYVVYTETMTTVKNDSYATRSYPVANCLLTSLSFLLSLFATLLADSHIIDLLCLCLYLQTGAVFCDV